MDSLASRIAAITGEDNLRIDEPMSEHTTFRTGGNAGYFIVPANEEQLRAVIALLKETETPFLVTGRGSNLLVSDKGIEGAVINIYHTFDEISIERNVDGAVVRAGAGITLAALASRLLKEELKGFEFASGIPGTLGGAVVMNAGAYGGEIKDVLVSARCMDYDGNLYEFSNEELQLSYRHSLIMERKLIVLEAVLEFRSGRYEDIKALMDDFNGRRRDKQPLEYPSAGSTFKRPEGNFAGKLIMEAGLAGFSVNGAQVSSKHCGFVINTGNATSSDIYELMQHVEKVVYDKTGIKLEPEVRLVGNWG